MALFENPTRIETVSVASWDWEVQNALLHARGAGILLPEPEVRYWTFQQNGLGVAARLSRDLLLAQIVCYDVWTFQLQGNPRQLTDVDLKKMGLPDDFAPAENLTPEEVEEFLGKISHYQRGGNPSCGSSCVSPRSSSSS